MTYDEQLEAARRAVRNPKPSSIVAIDSASIEAAGALPRIVDLSPIIGWLSGAPQQAQNADQYYQNAAGQTGNYYQDALNKIVNSTGSGSPAAETFGAEERAALAPQFQAQAQALTDQEAAQGIGPSGAGKQGFTNLGNTQAATLAGAISPLYQAALDAYNSGALQGAGSQSGLVGQGAGAANQAYGQAINDFYGGLGAGAGAYGYGTGGNSAPASSPGVPDMQSASYGTY